MTQMIGFLGPRQDSQKEAFSPQLQPEPITSLGVSSAVSQWMQALSLKHKPKTKQQQQLIPFLSTVCYVPAGKPLAAPYSPPAHHTVGLSCELVPTTLCV